MLRRLVSLLLIPFFVLGSATPHSHAGSGAPVPSDHSARPHVHVGSHDHGSHGHPHGHEHDEPGIPLDAPADDKEGRPADCPLDHDADAVYLLDSGECIPTSAPVQRDRDEPLLTFLPQLSDSPSSATRRPVCGGTFLPHNGLPIFLFVAALRL